MSASVSSYDLSAHARGLSYSDRALAAPRPPASAIASRSTASVRRHHRASRSQHGGSSYLPQNEYPVFSTTGDVEILIQADGQERRYVLHRLILAQNSGFFAASTSEAWRRERAETKDLVRAGGDDSKALEAIGEESDEGRKSSSERLSLERRSLDHARTRQPMLRYELDWGEHGEDEVPMLVQKPAQTSIFGGDAFIPRAPPTRAKSKPPASSNALFRSVGAMQSAMHLPSFSSSAHNQPSSATAEEEPSDTIRDYDNLFRIFYNHPPVLDVLDITEAYIQSKTLLALADQYDALAVVGPRVDHHLLTFQSRLWKQVAKYPPSYLKLGYAARSKAIFGEALAHVVGQWPQGSPQLKTVPEPVRELIEDKAADLDDLKARVEARLFRLSLHTKHGERVSPSNAWWDWQAVSLFRHWLAENVTPAAPPQPPPPPPALQPALTQTGNGQRAANGQQRPAQRTAGRDGTRNNQRLPPVPVSVPVPPPQPPPRTNSLVSPSVQNLSTLLASPLPQASGRLFRLLGLGGPAYLTHEECKRFVRSALGDHHASSSTSSTREVVRKFERRLDEIKDAAREIVRPLLRNALELEIGGAGGLGYLTCTRVDEGEWPW